MLNHIILHSVTEDLEDATQRDVARLRLQIHADIISVSMDRRQWVSRDDGTWDDKQRNYRLMEDLPADVDEKERDEHPVLLCECAVDAGDLLEAVNLLTHASDRDRARTEAEKLSEEQERQELTLEAARITAEEATKKLDKHYREWEETDAERRELRREVRGLRWTVETLVERLRQAGLDTTMPEQDADAVAAKAKELAEKITEKVTETPEGIEIEETVTVDEAEDMVT